MRFDVLCFRWTLGGVVGFVMCVVVFHYVEYDISAVLALFSVLGRQESKLTSCWYYEVTLVFCGHVVASNVVMLLCRCCWLF